LADDLIGAFMDDKDHIGWELLGKIEEQREWRRENPAVWLTEIAADLWRNMEDKEALDHFIFRMRNVPWWATDVVECLELVLRERPDWAVPSLIDGMQAGEWLGPIGKPKPYFDWLAKQARPMRKALDAASASE
jgi:hypothetical protein